MKNGGDPSNPQEMAKKMMMGSAAQNGGQAGQVGMAQMGQMGQRINLKLNFFLLLRTLKKIFILIKQFNKI